MLVEGKMDVDSLIFLSERYDGKLRITVIARVRRTRGNLRKWSPRPSVPAFGDPFVASLLAMTWLLEFVRNEFTLSCILPTPRGGEEFLYHR
jgi:hypothetical protein